MEARCALSVGVSSFEGHEQLEFAQQLAGRLGDVLSDLEYKVRVVAPERLQGSELADEVNSALSGSPTDVAVVHLISHGERADGGATVFALGSDSTPHADASIAHWLTMQQAEDRPTTLFLLDLCGAGTLARLPWQTALEKPLRGWVIAACGEAESAYDGRFTQAVVSVLEALRDGELDIDPSMRHVPLSTFARVVRQEVNRLAAEADSFPQQVTASLVDISSDMEAPFFLNPAYDPATRPRLRASVDPGLLPFLDDLDEGLDARHFLERATGLGRLTDSGSGLVGCFTGRDHELRQVSPWLNGVGRATLCVVTGSPGAGKSALLGVLVCAAHRALRDATRPIWENVAQWPLPIDHLAAVHARQRGVATVAASIARQLGLPENVSVTELVALLRGRAERPVLVVDALDEADDPVVLMTDLLLPLIAGDTPGTPVRLLVGVRSYEEYQPLFDVARTIDLDEVEQHVLEDNLFDYVKSLLRTTVDYRQQGGVVGAFAHAVASVLANPENDGGRKWGPFLVAGLYTRHFIAAHTGQAVTDAGVAAERGKAVPADLRGVLELDLGLEEDAYWLRGVLGALAHARGAGMPVSVLTRVSPAFTPEGGRATAGQIRAALNLARFYLRQSMDSDRSNVYRLFHQGLADTLAESTSELHGPALDALLSSLGPADQRDWNAAEPYVLRHVLAHATDAGRADEIESDPGFALHPDSPLATTATGPAELALAAVRAGNRVLAWRAANIPGRVPLAWQPRWAFGVLSWETESAEDEEPRYEQIAISDDGRTVVAASGGKVASWTWQTGGPELAFTTVGVKKPRSVHIMENSVVLVGDVIRLIDLVTRTALTAHTNGDLRAVMVDGESNLMCVNAAGTIFRYYMPGVGREVVYETRHGDREWTLARGKSRVVAVCSHEDQSLIRFEDNQAWLMPVPATGVITSFALNTDGRYLAVVTDSGWFGVCDLLDDRRWLIEETYFRPLTTVALAPNGSWMAFGGKEGRVSLYRVDSAKVWHVTVSKHPITQIALSQEGRGVAVDARGNVFGFDHLGDASSAVALTSANPMAGTGVTAFLEVRGDLAVGLRNGTLADVSIATGKPRAGLKLDHPARELALVDIGGVEGIVVTTDKSCQLLHGYFGPPMDLGSADWMREQFAVTEPSARIGVDHGLLEVSNENGVLWRKRLRGNVRHGSRLGEHPRCQVVRCAYFDGRPLAFSGGHDGVVRVWDLEAGELRDTIAVGGPVHDIRLVAGRRMLVLVGGELLAFEHFDESGKDGA